MATFSAMDASSGKTYSIIADDISRAREIASRNGKDPKFVFELGGVGDSATPDQIVQATRDAHHAFRVAGKQKELTSGGAKARAEATDSPVASALAPYMASLVASDPGDVSPAKVVKAGAKDILSFPGRALASTHALLPNDDTYMGELGRTTQDEGTSFAGRVLRDPVTGGLAALSMGLGELPALATRSAAEAVPVLQKLSQMYPKISSMLTGGAALGGESAVASKELGEEGDSPLMAGLAGFLGGSAGSALNALSKSGLVTAIAQKFNLGIEDASRLLEKYAATSAKRVGENTRGAYQGAIRAIEDMSAYAPNIRTAGYRPEAVPPSAPIEDHLLSNINELLAPQASKIVSMTRDLVRKSSRSGEQRKASEKFINGDTETDSMALILNDMSKNGKLSLKRFGEFVRAHEDKLPELREVLNDIVSQESSRLARSGSFGIGGPAADVESAVGKNASQALETMEGVPEILRYPQGAEAQGPYKSLPDFLSRVLGDSKMGVLNYATGGPLGDYSVYGSTLSPAVRGTAQALPVAVQRNTKR